jgi:hypothetical protein
VGVGAHNHYLYNESVNLDWQTHCRMHPEFQPIHNENTPFCVMHVFDV